MSDDTLSGSAANNAATPAGAEKPPASNDSRRTITRDGFATSRLTLVIRSTHAIRSALTIRLSTPRQMLMTRIFLTVIGLVYVGLSLWCAIMPERAVFLAAAGLWWRDKS